MKKKNFYLSMEKGDLLPILLLLPTMTLIFFVLLVPLMYGIFLSFFSFDFGKFDLANSTPVLSNYIKFFNDRTAIRSVLNSVMFSIGAIAGDMILGTLAAVLIFRMRKIFADLFRPVITIPLLVSPIIVGLIWRYVYDPQGILYWFLGLFGIGIKQFPGVTSQSTALLSTIIAHWWQVVPFIIIVLTAGLVSVPLDLYEAAYIDGAGSVKAFQMITFPMLRSLYMVILLISGVDTIKAFDIIYSLTGGGPNNSTITISLYAYRQGFENVDIGYAMSLSVIAMIITLIMFGVPFIKHNLKRSRE